MYALVNLRMAVEDLEEVGVPDQEGGQADPEERLHLDPDPFKNLLYFFFFSVEFLLGSQLPLPTPRGTRGGQGGTLVFGVVGGGGRPLGGQVGCAAVHK